MTIFVTCAHDPSLGEFAQSRLHEIGVKPADLGKVTGLSVSDLITHVLNDLERQARLNYEQIQIGKAWDFAAADILMSNSNGSDWGWADPRNIYLLDYWQNFEPQAKFVLVYTSLQQSLASAFAAYKGPTSLEAFFADWESYHKSMLEFSFRFPEQCLIVHTDHLEGNAGEFVRSVDHLAKRSPSEAQSDRNITIPATLRMVAKETLKDSGWESTIYSELENTAHLPSSEEAKSDCDLSDLVRAEYELSHIRLKSTGEVAAQQKERASTLASENEALRSKLKEMESELSARNSRAIAEVTLTESSVELRHLQEENELLMLQLTQVQEELEFYFRKYQENSNSGAAYSHSSEETPEKSEAAQSKYSVDLKAPLSGSGWHQAEPHGRWAGASQTSTIQLEKLPPKPIEIRIRVVDAITVDHLYGVSVSLNGNPLETKTIPFADMGGRLAPIRRLKSKVQKVEKPYPATIIAKVKNTGAISQAGGWELSLTSEAPIRPSSMGGADDRPLSICVETIDVLAVP